MKMKGATLKAVLDTIMMMIKSGDPAEEIQRYMDDSIKLSQSEDIRRDLLDCKSCDLCSGNRVPAEGDIRSPLMLVGEGPGEHEDRQRRPFVGPAGQLLDKILAAAEWGRSNLYLTNVVKCRAWADGKNIQPNSTEIAACMKHLRAEIEMVKPKIIVCLGAVAANALIHPRFKMTEEHGHWFEIAPGQLAIAIYHPSYLLHKGEGTEEQEEAKEAVWNDIQTIKAKMIELLGTDHP
jgi:DNA polymerase